MTDERLAEIESRLRAGSLWPWFAGEGKTARVVYGPDCGHYAEGDDDGNVWVAVPHDDLNRVPDGQEIDAALDICACSTYDRDSEYAANAQLIAHAPEDLADCVAEIRRLREEQQP